MPQINTRTFAGVVIALLGLAACGGASRSQPTTTASSIDLDASPDPDDLLLAQFARSFTDGLQARGLAITRDQADCMAKAFLNELGPEGLEQTRRDGLAGKPYDSALLDRGARATIGCLPRRRGAYPNE